MFWHQTSLDEVMPAGPDDFVTCHQHDGLVDKRWDKSFAWSDELQQGLENNFGTKTFRANQRQAINASLAGKDVFVLMPTGGGVLILFTTVISLCNDCFGHLKIVLTLNCPYSEGLLQSDCSDWFPNALSLHRECPYI